MQKQRLIYALSQTVIGFFLVVWMYFLEYTKVSKSFPTYEFFKNLIIVSLFLCVFGYIYYPRYLRKQKERARKMEMKMESLYGPPEFKCFKCSHIIKPENQKCSNCGWTWNF